MTTSKLCVVYWLYNDQCVCPEQHGYIGITDRPSSRLARHREDKRLPTNFKWKALFVGERNESLALEFRLRPYPNMGWNRKAGGLYGNHSNQTRQQMRQHALKRYLDPVQRAQLAEYGRRANPANISAALKGHGTSKATRTRIADSLTGRTHTETSRAKMSTQRKGKPKSAEWKALMSAKAKARYTDPAEREKMSLAVKEGLKRARTP